MLLVSLIAASLFSLSSAGTGIVCNAHPKGKPMKPYNCNWRGSVGAPRGLTPNPYTYTPLSAGDETRPVITCRNLCYNTAKCKSYSVDRDAPNALAGCTLYTSRIRAMQPGPTDPSSSVLFNNIACTTAELAQGFMDSDFESGALYGWGIGRHEDPSFGVFAVSGNPYGDRSGFVAQLISREVSGPNVEVAVLFQTVTLCPGVTYDVSFDYYIPSGDNTGPNPGELAFNIYPVNVGPAAGSYDRIYLDEADADVWKTDSFTFTYPADADYAQVVWTLYSGEDSVAAAIVDNLVLTPASVLA